jgi:hypothetical protein
MFRERFLPNRFQSELARRNGVIAGRRWSCQRARGKRVPVEMRPCAAGFTKNDILTSRAQRAFAVLDQAGAWRRLAAEYLASGDADRGAACKRAAHDHLFSAVRARIEAESVGTSSSLVIAGLDPAIPLRLAPQSRHTNPANLDLTARSISSSTHVTNA